jgi:Caspase domain
MAAGRMVCLAVGIGETEGIPDYLDGALHAARDFHGWATNLGYESVLLTDETDNGPPTLDNIRNALEGLLPWGSATERLILFFAGHGLTGDEDSGLWFPADWQEKQTVIGVDSLRRRLARYGVAQVSIVGDACNAPASTAELRRVDVSGLLGDGFVRPDLEPMTDRFLAAQDGIATFMIPGTDESESRCLLSGVLLEGLWGHSKDAFSARAPSLVISQSLAGFVHKRGAEIAEHYKLPFRPNPKPGFLEGKDVYFDKDTPPPNIPPMADWPPVPDEVVKQALDQMTSPVGERLFPQGVDVSAVETMVVISKLRGDPAIDGVDSGQMNWISARAKERKAAEFKERSQKRREEAVKQMLLSAQAPEGQGPVLVIEGQAVKSIFHPPGTTLAPVASGIWSIDGVIPGSSCQLLVEFENGTFGACVAMWDMSTRMIVGTEGVAGLVLQPTYSQFDEIQESIATTELVIANLYADSLSKLSKIDLAVRLRMIKHVNPVLGVISAYLYDSIGDTESIRRMAYFYAWKGQAIPYDIVFLANLWTRGDNEGQFEVTIDAQEERPARTEIEKQFEWATQYTPKIEGKVAGNMPWLSRGWPYLESPSEAERTMSNQIMQIRREVFPTPFTTVTANAGRQLVQLFRLVATQAIGRVPLGRR